MADKRGSWSRNDLNAIWDNYTNNIVPHLYQLSNFDLDYSQETLCYLCDDLILKAQYEGWQPNGDFVWNVEHFDGDPYNNDISNLFIAHPWCNREKGDKSISEMLYYNWNNFRQKYQILKNMGLIN